MTSSSTGAPSGRLATPYTKRQGLLALPTTTTCRFESDASATTDHNNGLPKELRFTVDRRSYGAHRSSDSTSSYENRRSKLVNGPTGIRSKRINPWRWKGSWESAVSAASTVDASSTRTTPGLSFL